jgi:3',5'-cyclic AMP phosphodiesterase CpdA
MSEKKSITILHLSDIQFGANHRFGVDVKTVDGSIETLLGRFTDDLKEMRDDYGLTPELIVLTGDLVEWAGMIKIQSERLFGLSPFQVCFSWHLSPWTLGLRPAAESPYFHGQEQRRILC